MDLLQKVKIINFRSFTEEMVKLNDVTSIVGANESGKSNLLEAVHHLSNQKQKTPFSPNDLRIGAPGYPSGTIEIEYTIKLNPSLIKGLLKDFPELEDKFFFLKKKGRPKVFPTWEFNSEIAKSSLPEIIQIHNKTNFTQAFRHEKPQRLVAKQRSAKGWFINDSSVDLRKNPYKTLLENGKIEVLRGDAKVNFLNQLIGEEILKNIKIYLWKYKEEDFLQENVSIPELIQNPGKYRSVFNMFIVSGWSRYELIKKLQNQTPTIYSNLLDQVKRNIDGLIKKHWSSHRNLKIIINHLGDYLSIHLKEPGSQTPPEFRSDGLKWFLTFLINIRAQSKNISNFVLLMDEPGLYLHPKGQKDALQELENLSKTNQIIYTTHQTFLVNKNHPQRVRIIVRETEKTSNSPAIPFYASKITNTLTTKNILCDRLLREALGFKVSDISPINEKNILVEGFFDRELLMIMNDYWKILNLNDISIISCGRASEIHKHANLYKSNGLKVLCFYDSDSAGISAFTNNQKVSLSGKLHFGKILNEPNIETPEDLIPETLFRESVEQLAREYDLTIEDSIPKPRMKSLEKALKGDSKIELKHRLEELLSGRVRKDLKRNGGNYKDFKKILEAFRTKLK